MKSLIIYAHPAKKNLSKLFAERYQKAHPGESEVIDLYDKKWRQDFLTFDDIKDIPTDETREVIQQKIREADELVFIFPVWWGNPPAIMKNFIDMNFTSGFAFRFLPNGKPEKLLTGKTAKIFATSDGPKFIYAMLAFPFFTILRMITLYFCGIKVTKAKLFDQARKRSKDEIEAWAQKIEHYAKN
jgi:putative NADPH-quinone reductase